MITAQDMDEAMVMARLSVDERIAEAFAGLYRPELVAAAAAAWKASTPRMREQMKRQDPHGFKLLRGYAEEGEHGI